MVNITTNGKVIILNGKSTIPVGTFRVFKNESLRTVTLYGINGYDLEISLVEGRTTVNGDIYPLQRLFDFICEHSAYNDSPTIDIGDGVEIDLSIYATKMEMASKADKSALNELVTKNSFETAMVKKVDNSQLNYYPTSLEVMNYLSNKADRVELNQFYNKQHIDYALGLKVTDEEVKNLIRFKADKSEIPDVSDYVKSDFVLNEISKIVIPEYNLNIYETKVESDSKLSYKADKSELPNMSLYVTNNTLNDRLSELNIPIYDLSQYAIANDVDSKLSLKANRSEIPNIDHLASKDYVDDAISSIDIPIINEIDLTPYATKSEVLSVLDAIPNTSDLTTKEYVDGKFESVLSEIPNIDLTPYVKSNDMDVLLSAKVDKSSMVDVVYHNDITDFITVDSLDDLARKNDLILMGNILDTKANTSDIANLASEDYVQEQFNLIQIPDVSIYDTIENVNIKLGTKLDKTQIPHPETLASKNYVLTEITKAKLDGDEVNLDGYVTIDQLTEVTDSLVSNTDLNNAIASINIPSLVGYATEQFVNYKIDNITPQDLSQYTDFEYVNNLVSSKADKTEIPSIVGLVTEETLSNSLLGKADKTEIPSIVGLVTINEVNNLLTSYDKTNVLNQKLNLKADKTEIPSLEGYIKTVDVQNMFDSIPENYLTPYDTISEVNEKLLLKADKDEIPSLDDYPTVAEVHSYVDGHPNIASKLFVESYINDLNLPDFSTLETKAEANNKYATKADTVYVDSKLNNYTKTNDMNNLLTLKLDKTEYIESVITERNISDEKYFAKPANPSAALYDDSGLVSLKPKIWIGTVISSTDGMFTATFTGADFTTPPMVVATANTKGDATAAANANWVSIYENSITTTGFRGRTKNANSAGLLAAMVSTNEPNVVVNIIAIGY